jgi:hypothetical protein
VYRESRYRQSAAEKRPAPPRRGAGIV